MYERFKHLLEVNDVTPYRVGKETGIPSTTFSEWKAGRSVPKRDKLKKIADYFEVPVSYFYGEDEQEVETVQMGISLDSLATDLREDQRNIIKVAASLTPDQVKAVDMFIRALKGEVPK